MEDNADNTGSLLWTVELPGWAEPAGPPASLGAAAAGVEAESMFFLFCTCCLLENGGGEANSTAETSMFSQSNVNSSS